MMLSICTMYMKYEKNTLVKIKPPHGPSPLAWPWYATRLHQIIMQFDRLTRRFFWKLGHATLFLDMMLSSATSITIIPNCNWTLQTPRIIRENIKTICKMVFWNGNLRSSSFVPLTPARPVVLFVVFSTHWFHQSDRTRTRQAGNTESFQQLCRFQTRIHFENRWISFFLTSSRQFPANFLNSVMPIWDY